MDSRTRKSSSTTTMCFAAFVISNPMSNYAAMVEGTRRADNYRFIQTDLELWRPQAYLPFGQA
jgi:hypothetical protein